MKKSLSYKYFCEYFNLGFGRPVVDACVKCEEEHTKIKSNVLNDSAKRVAAAELLVQKRKIMKFYSTLGSVTKTCQNDTKTFGI